jgi:hypothetical protein
MGLFIFLASAGVATANQCHLNGGEISFVPVWENEATINAGIALMKRGESNPALIIPLMACLPKNGDRAIVNRKSQVGTFITVMPGSFAGCRVIVDKQMCDTR